MTLWSPSCRKQQKRSLHSLNGGNVTDKAGNSYSQRLDVEEVMKKVEELHPPVQEEKEDDVIDIEPKEEITFDDFMKLQFQVGEIICLRRSQKVKEITLLSGKNRKSGKTDCFRNPQGTYTARRNGWQKSYGTGEPKTCQT